MSKNSTSARARRTLSLAKTQTYSWVTQPLTAPSFRAGWSAYPWSALIATLSAVGVLILEGCITAFYVRTNVSAVAAVGPADVEAKGSAIFGPTLGSRADSIATHAHGGQALDLEVREDKIRLLTIAQVRPGPSAELASCAFWAHDL